MTEAAGAVSRMQSAVNVQENARGGLDYMASRAEDKELEEIFARTYGRVERKRSGFERTVYRAPKVSADSETGSSESRSASGAGSSSGGNRGADSRKLKNRKPEKEYLLVDGYNIIFVWEELSELAAADIGAARGKLMDILSGYQGFRKQEVILVFDAYKVEGGVGEIYRYHNIHVVFTKEAETADQYIEKTVHEIGRNYQVTVATSDGLEQVIIMGQGARRLSARDFRTEVEKLPMWRSARSAWRSVPVGSPIYSIRFPAKLRKPLNSSGGEKTGISRGVHSGAGNFTERKHRWNGFWSI